MLTIIHILLWLIVVVVVVFVLLLATPLKLRLSLQNDPATRFLLVVRPFGGAFPAIPVFDSSRKPKKSAQKRAKKRPKKSKTKRRPVNVKAINTLPDAIMRMFAAVRFEQLSIDAEFGTGDPADTGQLFGSFTPLMYISNGLPRSHINLRPNFDRVCLRGFADMQFRVTPIVFVWPLVGFLWRLFGPTR